MFVDSHSWERVVPTLSTRRTLILVDAPSCGRSDPLDRAADIAACADAASVVVDEVCSRYGVDRVDWLGNAWGGHVGMHLAATRAAAIRSLVAISAPTFPIDDSLRQKIRLLKPLYRLIGPRGPVRSAIEDGILTEHTRATDPEAVAVLRDALAASGKHMITAIDTAILNRTDLAWAARAITCPTLFIATEDRGEWSLDQAQAVVDTMTGAVATTVLAARVIPALEQPAETAQKISAFWNRIDEGQDHR
ncbi:MAG: alpha/beta hydrolase [Gordonia sp.]|nr:alpha/beta hydrolase [Gordonia sp. (in: high G+C Gram-positive bacteria)]